MKKYEVLLSWIGSSYHEVEADSKEEAISKAEEEALDIDNCHREPEYDYVAELEDEEEL